MKKLLAIILCLALVFSLAACGGETPEEPAGETGAQTGEQTPENNEQNTGTSSPSQQEPNNNQQEEPNNNQQEEPNNNQQEEPNNQGQGQTGNDEPKDPETPATTQTIFESERTLNKTGAVKKVDTLANTYNKLTKDKKLNVAYFGGSVTGGQGGTSGYCWRTATTDWFKTNFPSAQVTEIDVSWGGTSSLWGYHRMDRDDSGSKANLIASKPDLVFVEFTVNDAYAHLTRMQSTYYMEGIVKKLRADNPKVDIVFVFVTDSGRLDKDNDFTLAHKDVAAHYGIPIINVGNALVAEIKAKNAKWEDYVNDIVHPNDKGYKVYADCIAEYLKKTFVTSPDKSGVKDHAKPGNDLVSNAIQGTEIIPASQITTYTGFKPIAGNSVNCPSFGGKHLFGKRGDTITVEFEGRGLALLIDGGGSSKIIVKINGEANVFNAAGGNNFEYVGIENLKYGKYTAEITVDMGTKVAVGGIMIEK